MYEAVSAVTALVASAVTSSAKEPTVYIWDGRSELAMSIRVTDADTHQPIHHATVTLVRSEDAKRGPDGALLNIPAPAQTDARGFAAFKATFAAEGDPDSTYILVGNSSLFVTAAGYAQGRNWVSTPGGSLDIRIEKSKAMVPLIGKLHFSAKTQKYKAFYHVALHRTP